jgi:hypothetical protein
MMKKQFAKLSKSAQEKAEQEYHRTHPDEFDHLMRQAIKHARPASKQKRKNRVTQKKRAA